VDQRPRSPPKFKMMWTPQGEPVRTLEELMDYVFDRWQEQSAGPAASLLPSINGSPGNRSGKQAPLILLSLHKSGRSKVSGQPEILINDGSLRQNDAESTDDGPRDEAQSHKFEGLKHEYDGMSKNEIRHSKSKDLKVGMLNINRKWSLKQ
jgi:hypothetical protein